jgi:hypothetical protein
VATSVAVTLAPGMAAPEGSVMVPLMLPRKVWELNAPGRDSSPTMKKKMERDDHLCCMKPPKGLQSA